MSLDQWQVAVAALGGGSGAMAWYSLIRHRRATYREVMREHDRRTGPSMLAGDNSVQMIVNGGNVGGTVVVTGEGSNVVVTGGAAGSAARLQAQLRQAAEDTNVVGVTKNGRRVVIEGGKPTVAPLPEPAVDSWCAGCDRLMASRWMAFTPEGTYRCRACRGESEQTTLQQRLQDAHDAGAADTESMARLIPLFVSAPPLVQAVLETPPRDPWTADNPPTCARPHVDPWLAPEPTLSTIYEHAELPGPGGCTCPRCEAAEHAERWEAEGL